MSLAVWSQAGYPELLESSSEWQSPVDDVEKQKRGIWSIAVLNVPWEVIVVVVASVASKQINLLTCGRKHQRKTMRKFYIILIVLCNFLPTSNLIFHQKTQHWKCPCGEREGEKICWSLLLGFHCELIFLKTLKRHFFFVFYRNFKWWPSEKCTLLRTAQQVIGKYFNSPARTLSSHLGGFVFTSGIRSGLDWQLSQQCSHAGCLDHLWTCFLTPSPHNSILAWSRDSHKWLWITIRDRFPRMIAFKYGKLPWNTTWGKRKTPGAELVSCFCFTSEKPKIVSPSHKIKYLKFVVLAWAELLEDLNQSKAHSFWKKT